MGLVKNIIYKIAFPLFTHLVKKRAIFPYYHLVNDKKVAHINHLYAYKNINAFKKDLDFLTQNYTSISPETLIQSIGKPPIPNNSFLLTFDDGLSEIYTTVYPILKARKISAMFFLNPNFIDNNKSLYKHDLSVIIEKMKSADLKSEVINTVAQKLGLSNPAIDDLSKRILQIKQSDAAQIEEIASLLKLDLKKYLADHKPYLTQGQIKEMIADGFFFGGHTMSHPRLPELPLEQQKEEVLTSMQWVKDTFELEYSSFAFPFSDKGISKSLINAIFDYDANALVFGNSGFRKDIHPRIIQRFSLEDSSKKTARTIITENIYLLYNKLIGKYSVKRA